MSEDNMRPHLSLMAALGRPAAGVTITAVVVAWATALGLGWLCRHAALASWDMAIATLIGLAAGSLVAAIGTTMVIRHMHFTLAQPLRAIIAVADAVRQDPASQLRAPRSHITEIDDMGCEFNALLDELQDWHGQLNLANEALLHRASYDPLSGLPNRASFIERVRDAIKAATRSGDRFAILFMDGDRFKATNDRFGHAAGDKVIADIAARVGPVLRAGDMAARLGGDEFAVLIHHLDDPDHADTVAARITAAMKEPIAVTKRDSIAITLSIGIAIYPDHGADVDALIHHADAQMYAQKESMRAT